MTEVLNECNINGSDLGMFVLTFLCVFIEIDHKIKRHSTSETNPFVL